MKIASGIALLVLSASLAGCGGSDDADTGAVAAPAAPESHRRMLAALRDVAARTPREHYYLGDGRARELKAELERLGPRAHWKLHLDAGVAVLQTGLEREGIDMLLATRAGLLDGSIAGDAAALAEVNFFLGVGYLRIAETENCCELPSEESCILPIRGGGLHARKEGSTAAIRYLEAVLDGAEGESYWTLATRWLLNLAYMTLGEYPDAVPERYLIPPTAFAPELDFPRFRNIAAAVGLDTFSHSGGVIADDFDGDDDLDLVVSTWDTKGQIRFWRHEDDGSFVDRTREAGLTGIFGGLNLVQADYDDDGDLDFLVLRGAWLFGDGRHPNSLVRNEGDGTFTDVTFDAGLGEVHYPTQTAAWADYDNDGDLDLYIGNESSRSAPFPGQLFRNEGDGTFIDVAKAAGVENFGLAKGVTWGDYDGDRFPDLYVSNNGSPNRLYHNRGDGTFVDVAEELGVAGPEASFPTWFWDYDNDGALDLFVSCYGTGIGHIAAYHLGRPREHDHMRLYRGDGKGGFEDVALELGLDYPALPMGANFGDLDNDGFLDFYLSTGNVHYYSVMPNVMFLNRGARGFVDVTMAGGFGHVQKGHAIAFADLDHDGDQDVFAEMGGAYAGDAFRNALFENPGFGNRWVAVKLVGTTTNRSAIGARIRVEVDEAGTTRSVYRHVNSGGSFGANPLRQSIGLGRAEAIRCVEVFWPTTGVVQRVEGVALDSGIRIVEGQDGFELTPLPELPFRRR